MRKQLEIIEYHREKWAIGLRIKPSRVIGNGPLDIHDLDHVNDVVTRWMRRCLLRQHPRALMGCLQMKVDRNTLFIEGIPLLVGWIWCFRDVAPADHDLLKHHIDRNPHDVFQVAHEIEPPRAP